MGQGQRMDILWELPLLWISDTAQHCAFLPGLPLLLPLHCYQCSAARNVLGAHQARTVSGCVGKISVIMSIQLCLGFFNLIEKSQRHYSSTLGGTGPCYILHGYVFSIQSSSAVPWLSVMVPAIGPWAPSSSLHPVSLLPVVPAVPAKGWGDEGVSIVASTSMTC